MKKLIIAVMLVAFAFTVAYAADVVTYGSKYGAVTFTHKWHADMLGCEACHVGTPTKIVIDKNAAHKDGCKNCHKEQGGPTKCNDCHIKGAGGNDPTDPVCIDNDYDGYSINGGQCGKKDCNDSDRSISPGAMEVCNDNLDNNCDGKIDCLDKSCSTDASCIICTDNDLDGYAVEGGGCGPADCNDNDLAISPGAMEVCNDNLDNNCDGKIDCLDENCVTDATCTICTDNDLDGYAVEGGGCGPADCNDNDLAISPGAVEYCSDSIDNDCDGLVDCSDADCNGNNACDEVCIPESLEERSKKCLDGIDNDCDDLIDCSDPDCNSNNACDESELLTGSWTGNGSSSVFPCTSSLSASLVESGKTISGTGSMTGSCGSGSGAISGTVISNRISFDITVSGGNIISFSGAVSEDRQFMSGTYSWPHASDNGSWSMSK